MKTRNVSVEIYNVTVNKKVEFSEISGRVKHFQYFKLDAKARSLEVNGLRLEINSSKFESGR